MPIQKSNLFNPGTPGITFSGNGQKWTIADGVNVGSGTSLGVISPFANNTLVNKGVVYAIQNIAVYFLGAKNAAIINKELASIIGVTGVYLLGNPNDDNRKSVVENEGSITGYSNNGVFLHNVSGSMVDNTGEIFGNNIGVHVYHSAPGPTHGSKIKNAGVIEGGDIGIRNELNPGLKTTVINKKGGIVEGTSQAIVSFGGALSIKNEGKLKGVIVNFDPGAKDKVINEGTIKGIIGLLGGDDTYKNKGGKAGLVLSGDGDDTLIAGNSKDKFVFDAPPNESTNVDRVENFESGKDMFFLNQFVFPVLVLGQLANSAFEKGKEADDLADRIIYHKKSGNLFYDEDGLGGVDQIQIAKLDKGQKLAAGDFMVDMFV